LLITAAGETNRSAAVLHNQIKRRYIEMDASHKTDVDTRHDAWRTIENPIEGVQLTFLETAEDTKGARIVVRMVVAPRGGVMPEFHTKFTETYEMLEGTLAFVLRGEAITLTPGRTIVVPPSTLHALRNESPSPITIRVVATPGTVAERGLRAYFGLCRDGLVTKAGLPKNPFVGALILHQSGTYFPPLPIWLSRIMFATFAVIGRLVGGEKTLARYWEPPKTKGDS
jgi:mannose-6-phosphate isomerase-like protein (cupin superfamily)